MLATPLRAPHLLDVVELADLGPEDVHDHAAGIDQDPVALAQAFDLDAGDAVGLEILDHAVGDGRDMDVRSSGGHDQGFTD